ncbi:MAG TPA: hypothetical protein DEF42_15900 [Desulfosporosinus sp.]|nr:hypothetical protein [Desulfosporosinus sp.]
MSDNYIFNDVNIECPVCKISNLRGLRKDEDTKNVLYRCKSCLRTYYPNWSTSTENGIFYHYDILEDTDTKERYAINKLPVKD